MCKTLVMSTAIDCEGVFKESETKAFKGKSVVCKCGKYEWFISKHINLQN